MSASVAKRTPKAKKPTAKEMAALLLKIEQERAQRYVVDVHLTSGAQVWAFVRDETVAKAIQQGYEAGDQWIDFCSADGGWVRLPRAAVQRVGYQPGNNYIPF